MDQSQRFGNLTKVTFDLFGGVLCVGCFSFVDWMFCHCWSSFAAVVIVLFGRCLRAARSVRPSHVAKKTFAIALIHVD